MVIRKASKLVDKHIKLFVKKYHERRHLNYLLKCPICKSEDLMYFKNSTNKMSLMAKVKHILRHEYFCPECNSFIPSKGLIRLELQRGDSNYVDEEFLREQERHEKLQKIGAKKQKEGLKELFGPEEEKPKKEFKLKLKIKEKPKKEKHVVKLEKDIEKLDEKDFIED